jgi:hypothetical protein
MTETKQEIPKWFNGEIYTKGLSKRTRVIHL